MTKAFTGKNALIDAMWYRYKHREDVMVIMQGEQSKGMSGSAIKMAEEVNRDFDKDRKLRKKLSEELCVVVKTEMVKK